MSPDTQISTGISFLDKDILRLKKYLKGERLKRLSESIEELSETAIEDSLDKELLSLVFGLLNPISYNRLLVKVNEDARKSFSSLREETVNKLAPVFLNKKIDAVVNRIAAEGEKERSSQEGEETSTEIQKIFNTPVRVESFPMLMGTPPKLLPAVRVALLSGTNDVLLEMSLDWVDIAFLLERFSSILGGSVELNKKLCSLKQLKIPERSAEIIKKRLNRLKQNITELQSPLKIYGI